MPELRDIRLALTSGFAQADSAARNSPSSRAPPRATSPRRSASSGAAPADGRHDARRHVQRRPHLAGDVATADGADRPRPRRHRHRRPARRRRRARAVAAGPHAVRGRRRSSAAPPASRRSNGVRLIARSGQSAQRAHARFPAHRRREVRPVDADQPGDGRRRKRCALRRCRSTRSRGSTSTCPPRSGIFPSSSPAWASRG